MEKIEKLTQMNEALQSRRCLDAGQLEGNRDDDSAMPSLSANERPSFFSLGADQNQPKKAPASSGNWLQNWALKRGPVQW